MAIHIIGAGHINNLQAHEERLRRQKKGKAAKAKANKIRKKEGEKCAKLANVCMSK